MGYETKVLLKAIYSLLERCKNLEEAKRLIAEMANVEKAIIKPKKKAKKPSANPKPKPM